jgi:hypothetical protein
VADLKTLKLEWKRLGSHVSQMFFFSLGAWSPRHHSISLIQCVLGQEGSWSYNHIKCAEFPFQRCRSHTSRASSTAVSVKPGPDREGMSLGTRSPSATPCSFVNYGFKSRQSTSYRESEESERVRNQRQWFYTLTEQSSKGNGSRLTTT